MRKDFPPIKISTQVLQSCSTLNRIQVIQKSALNINFWLVVKDGHNSFGVYFFYVATYWQMLRNLLLISIITSVLLHDTYQSCNL